MKYNYDRKIHENSFLRHLIVSSVFLIIVLGIIFFSDYGFYKLWKLQSYKNDLINQRKSINLQTDSLKQKINLLKTDSSEIERIAREKYGLVKKNEKIFIVETNSEQSVKNK